MTQEPTQSADLPEDLQSAQENVAHDAGSAPEAQPDPAQHYEEEIKKLKDMYLRAMAETENVRARAKRDMEDTAKYAVTRFARDMVNIIENLDRASASIPPETRTANPVLKQVGEGIDMTMSELLGIFERNGIKRISPAGEKFDHNYHQAVSQIPNTDTAPGTVMQVLQAGYTLHDRLLRPAMVTVAATPKEAS